MLLRDLYIRSRLAFAEAAFCVRQIIRVWPERERCATIFALESRILYSASPVAIALPTPDSIVDMGVPQVDATNNPLQQLDEIDVADLDQSESNASESPWTITSQDEPPAFGLNGAAPNAGDVLAVTNANGGPVLVNNETIQAANDVVTIRNTHLLVTDGANPPDSIYFTLVRKPLHGALLFGGASMEAFDFFTQADINLGFISYAHDLGNELVDSFDFIVDAPGGSIDVSTFLFNAIRNDDQPPFEVRNSGGTLDEGSFLALTDAHIEFRDLEQPDSAMTYTIVESPTFGRLVRNDVRTDVRTDVVTSFSHDDLLRGVIQYWHDGSETTIDHFRFDVDDGQGNSTRNHVFDLAISPVNDPPLIAELAPINLDENSPDGMFIGTVTATDPDGPTQRFEIQSGNTGNAFTIDSDNGQIHVGNSAAIDYEQIQTFNLVVSVRDEGSPESQDTTIVAVTVIDVDDSPVPEDPTTDPPPADSNTVDPATIDSTQIDSANPDDDQTDDDQTDDNQTDDNQTDDDQTDDDQTDDDQTNDDQTDDANAPTEFDETLDIPIESLTLESRRPLNPNIVSQDIANGTLLAIENFDGRGPLVNATPIEDEDVVPIVGESLPDNSQPSVAHVRLTQGTMDRMAWSTETRAVLKIASELKLQDQLDRGEHLIEYKSDATRILALQAAAIVSTGLSVGYVAWLLRGGSLLVSFLSSIPTWQSYDPLPILETFDGESNDEDGDSLASIVDY